MGKIIEDVGLKQPIQIFAETMAMTMIDYALNVGIDDAVQPFTDLTTEKLQKYPHLLIAVNKAKEKNERLEDIDEKLRHIPHVTVIKENGETIIPSIFMFKDIGRVMEFLYAAKKMNSTVIFENENLTVCPNDVINEEEIIGYGMIMNNHKSVGDYLCYMVNIEKMKWEDEQEQGE